MIVYLCISTFLPNSTPMPLMVVLSLISLLVLLVLLYIYMQNNYYVTDFDKTRLPHASNFAGLKSKQKYAISFKFSPVVLWIYEKVVCRLHLIEVEDLDVCGSLALHQLPADIGITYYLSAWWTFVSIRA